MVNHFRQVALVKSSYSFSLVNPLYHLWKYKLFLCRIHKSVSSYEDFERVEEGGGDHGGYDSVEQHPENRGSGIIADHFEALELNGSIEGLASKVDFGGFIEARNAFLPLN